MESLYSSDENVEAKKEILFRESFVFILDLIRYTDLLKKKQKTLSKQILKAGTYFGKRTNEIRFSNEKTELSELKKNANEIKYLLLLCKYSENYSNPNNLISDLDKLINQISTIG